MKNGIFIGYINTTKHITIWALHINQVLIASKYIQNEASKGALFLINHLMPLPQKLFQETASEPKPRRRPQQNDTKKKLAVQPRRHK